MNVMFLIENILSFNAYVRTLVLVVIVFVIFKQRHNTFFTDFVNLF